MKLLLWLKDTPRFSTVERVSENEDFDPDLPEDESNARLLGRFRHNYMGSDVTDHARDTLEASDDFAVWQIDENELAELSLMVAVSGAAGNEDKWGKLVGAWAQRKTGEQVWPVPGY